MIRLFPPCLRTVECSCPVVEPAARLVVGLAIVFMLAMAQGAQAAEVRDVRFGVNTEGKTRIVLDMNEETKYRAELRSDVQGRKFLAVELAHATFGIAGNRDEAGAGKGIGVIDGYAWSSTLSGRGQLLFEMEQTAVLRAVFLIKPKKEQGNYRLVVDLAGASEKEFAAKLGQTYGSLAVVKPKRTASVVAKKPTAIKANAPKQEKKTPIVTAAAARPSSVPDASTMDDGREPPFGLVSASTRALAIAAANKAGKAIANKPAIIAVKLSAKPNAKTLVLNGVPVPRHKPVFAQLQLIAGRPIIVIDPGHGGKHPGSVGQSGLLEKNVTLAASKTLKKLLVQRGYNVLLTRRTDEFVDLPDRMEFARAQNADLFLSIHADGNEVASIRGGSVYTLSDKGSVRLARQAKGDFQLFQKDLTKISTSVDARAIAFDLAAANSRQESSRFADMLIAELAGDIKMLNNTHRQANYKVLLSPDVPAVLLELAFVSNEKDEANLNSRVWRKKAMEAAAQSIDVYFEDRKPTKQAMNEAGGQ